MRGVTALLKDRQFLADGQQALPERIRALLQDADVRSLRFLFQELGFFDQRLNLHFDFRQAHRHPRAILIADIRAFGAM